MKEKIKKMDKIKLSKILVVAYMALTFLSILMPDEFVIGIMNLDYRLDAFQMLMRWFNFASFIILPVAVFFDRPTFKRISIYFCLPIAVIFIALFWQMLPYFTSERGTGICDIRYFSDFVPKLMKNGIFRSILFFATSLTQIGTIVLLVMRDTSVLQFKKADILPFAIILPCSIASVVPMYALEGIFDTWTNVVFSFFKPAHVAWIIWVVVEIVVLTLLFRKRPMEDRYILVLMLSLSLLLQFNQLFSSLGELTCKRMPFQLCNIAAYLIFISIATKKRSMFLFNILVNVAGGVIALIVMDVENNGILNKSNIHYIVEHNNVIVVPLLCLFLRVFEPIKMKDFKLFAAFFTGYYLFVFVLGTTFNSLRAATGSDYFFCNYLFMFDQETAARLVGFAGKLFDIKVTWGHVTFYPVIQGLIYAAFFAIGTAMFFILKFAVRDKNKPSPDVKAKETKPVSAEKALLGNVTN